MRRFITVWQQTMRPEYSRLLIPVDSITSVEERDFGCEIKTDKEIIRATDKFEKVESMLSEIIR